MKSLHGDGCRFHGPTDILLTVQSQQSQRTLRSPLLSAAGFSHAFFTRCGGASAPPFDSLNFAIHVGDDPSLVSENLRRAAKDLGVDHDKILFLHQVHGTDTHCVAPPFTRDESIQLRGDALVACNGSVACSVRVADCVPILLADRRSGAAAAVHSGWRGTQHNIVAHVVCYLRNYVSTPIDLIAAVGPHIQSCCFEVGYDVASKLSAASPVEDAVHIGPGARPHVDLRRIIHAQLLEAGVGDDRIDHVKGCTVCEKEHFFSFRRDGERSGRLLAAIVPSPT
ncbi:MAG: hypothetical protein CSA75_01470 [Sorangium cellulosum]|nr:MAG: hypothetical protein CSA75_01470 [Sorangium cellulosum]